MTSLHLRRRHPPPRCAASSCAYDGGSRCTGRRPRTRRHSPRWPRAPRKWRHPPRLCFGGTAAASHGCHGRVHGRYRSLRRGERRPRGRTTRLAVARAGRRRRRLRPVLLVLRGRSAPTDWPHFVAAEGAVRVLAEDGQPRPNPASAHRRRSTPEMRTEMTNSPTARLDAAAPEPIRRPADRAPWTRRDRPPGSTILSRRPCAAREACRAPAPCAEAYVAYGRGVQPVTAPPSPRGSAWTARSGTAP